MGLGEIQPPVDIQYGRTVLSMIHTCRASLAFNTFNVGLAQAANNSLTDTDSDFSSSAFIMRYAGVSAIWGPP